MIDRTFIMEDFVHGHIDDKKADTKNCQLKPDTNSCQFVYRPKFYPGPIALDAKVSPELDAYHKNAKVQINLPTDFLPKSTEPLGNPEELT